MLCADYEEQMRAVVGLPEHSFSPLCGYHSDLCIALASLGGGCRGLQGTCSTKDYIERMNYEFKMKWPR